MLPDVLKAGGWWTKPTQNAGDPGASGSCSDMGDDAPRHEPECLGRGPGDCTGIPAGRAQGRDVPSCLANPRALGAALAELRVRASPGDKGLLQPLRCFTAVKETAPFNRFQACRWGLLHMFTLPCSPHPHLGPSRCPRRPRWAPKHPDPTRPRSANLAAAGARPLVSGGHRALWPGHLCHRVWQPRPVKYRRAPPVGLVCPRWCPNFWSLRIIL